MVLSETGYEGRRFVRRFTFRFGDCDANKRASVFAVMKLLSEASGEDYEGRGMGHSFLWERGQSFIIARMAIEFDLMPRHTQTVLLSTWERGAKGPYFHRDYEMRDEKGALLAAGTSQWLLVDPLSREILRPAELFGGLPAENPDLAPCAPCKRIRPKGELSFLGQRPVYYSDLDANGHVNNAVYGKIASDFLPEDMRKLPVKRLDVNFNMETRLGETLELYGGTTPGGYMIQGKSGSTLRFGCEFAF